MADVTTNDVTMDALDTLIIESIKTIRRSKKKGPDEQTIQDILGKERRLTEVKLADINDRLVFLIKEKKINKNQTSHVKNSYFILNSNPDYSYESVSETDHTTPTSTI